MIKKLKLPRRSQTLNRYAFEILDATNNEILHASQYDYKSIELAETAGTEWCFDNCMNIPVTINTPGI